MSAGPQNGGLLVSEYGLRLGSNFEVYDALALWTSNCAVFVSGFIASCAELSTAVRAVEVIVETKVTMSTSLDAYVRRCFPDCLSHGPPLDRRQNPGDFLFGNDENQRDQQQEHKQFDSNSVELLQPMVKSREVVAFRRALRFNKFAFSN